MIKSIDCFYSILCSHGLHDRANTEVKSWIKILVGAIDIGSRNFEKRLRLLFPNEGVCILASSPFKEFITEEVSALTSLVYFSGQGITFLKRVWVHAPPIKF